MATITGEDILRRMYEMRALDQPGAVDQSQAGWLNWGELGGDLPFMRGSAQGGDQRVDPEALAQFLTANQYSIGQEYGPGNADVRWLEDAAGKKLIQPTNYATNDRTAALIGMGLLGGMLGTAVAGGVGVTGAGGGVGAGYGTGSAAFGDAAAAAAGPAAAGTGSAGGSMSDPVAGSGYGPIDSVGTMDPIAMPGEPSMLGPGPLEGPIAIPPTPAGPNASLLQPTVSPSTGAPSPSAPSPDGATPDLSNLPSDAYQWLKDNPQLGRLLFGGLGGLLTQIGGDDSGGSTPYTGPMPTITRGNWSPTATPTMMAKPEYPGLMALPTTGYENAGLLRYLKGKP